VGLCHKINKRLRGGKGMAKSKIQETHKLSIEGILDIRSDNTIRISVEDIGDKELSDLLLKFNGENVKFGVALNNEITE
jgi:hypothetical protein